MCGIIGYIGDNNISKKNFNIARDLISHRGPNWGETKIYKKFNKQIYFGHRRLSIIDISSSSNQPYEFQNLSLIFNGEIYNYIELRDLLKKKGYQFHTTGDTEVLIKSIHCWGKKVFSYLDGMWSFACINKISGDILISRDRFGEKPLYYYKNNNTFIFCSEVTPILKLFPNSGDINKNSILRFCINGYKSVKKVNETFYNKIKELPSGNNLIFSKNKIKIYQYWKPQFNPVSNLTYSDVVENIKEKLIKSLKQKLRSDVKLAFTLSGGIDSNSLISIAKRILKYDVHAFSILNKNKSYDEKKFINRTINNLNINHQYIELENRNFIEDITNIISERKLPILTISHYLYGKLTKSMSDKGFKVVLSGYGADEIFTGYYDHFNLFFQHLKSKKLKKFKDEVRDWNKYIKPWIRNPYLQKPLLYHKNKNFRSHIYLNNNLFTSFLKKNWSENFFEKNYTNDLLRNRMLNETFNEIVPISLFEEDLQSMRNSMENRSPYLDKDIFEYMLKVPTQYLISSGYSKKILRDSMNGIVDHKILWNRRKVGFNAPINEIYDINKKKNREVILDNSEIFELFDKNKIENIFTKNKNKIPNSISKFIFNFLSCKIFLENR